MIWKWIFGKLEIEQGGSASQKFSHVSWLGALHALETIGVDSRPQVLVALAHAMFHRIWDRCTC